MSVYLICVSSACIYSFERQLVIAEKITSKTKQRRHCFLSNCVL